MDADGEHSLVRSILLPLPVQLFWWGVILLRFGIDGQFIQHLRVQAGTYWPLSRTREIRRRLTARFTRRHGKCCNGNHCGPQLHGWPLSIAGAVYIQSEAYVGLVLECFDVWKG